MKNLLEEKKHTVAYHLHTTPLFISYEIEHVSRGGQMCAFRTPYILVG